MKKVAELESRIKELEDAVEWALLWRGNSALPDFRDELRARAFPPQFEEVEEHGYSCSICHITYGTERRAETCCDSGAAYSAEVKITIPIPTKVKRREQVLHTGRVVTVSGIEPPPHRNIYVEWYEE